VLRTSSSAWVVLSLPSPPSAHAPRPQIWDIKSRRIRNTFEGHQQEIYSLEFSRDGMLIVSGSGDRTARIWSLADGSHKTLPIHEPDNIDSGVTSVAISPDARLVAAGSLDTVVRIWDVTTGVLIERLRGHKDSVYSVAFTPDGKGLISGSLDKTLKYWDVRAVGMPKPGPGGAQIKDDKSLCTMNFTGHKVRRFPPVFAAPRAWRVGLVGRADAPRAAGLRALRRRLARRAVDRVWIQGPWRAVLGLALGRCAAHVTGS
jgi:WD40 repeat protein